MTEWRFFSHSHPDEARDQRTRKRIRAHITRRQHALKRQVTEESPAARRLTEPAAESEGSLPQPSGQHVPHGNALAFRQQPVPNTEQCWALLKTPYQNSEPLRAREDRLVRSSKRRELDDDHRLSQIATSPSIEAVQLNAAPVPQKQWYGWLHDYWFNGTLPRAVNLLKINNEQLQRYIAWMWRLQNSEPAMYYMSLLIATGIPYVQFLGLSILWATF